MEENTIILIALAITATILLTSIALLILNQPQKQNQPTIIPLQQCLNNGYTKEQCHHLTQQQIKKITNNLK